MTKDEALKLALKAFEEAVATCFDQWAHEQVMSRPDHFINETITAIREVLAQPEQEPAVQGEPVEVKQIAEALRQVGLTLVRTGGSFRVMDLGRIEAQTTSQPAVPERKPWVGLTDEEVMVAAYQAGFEIHEDYENEDDPEAMHWWTPDGEACDDSLLKLRDLIEAKLKEKNT